MAENKLGELIGDRVYELRRRANLSQKELAARVSVGVMAISRLERGVVTPSVTHLAAVAKALDVALADLFDFYIKDPEQSRRKLALKRLTSMLCQRQTSDVEAVVEIVERIFGIMRRRKRAPELRP